MWTNSFTSLILYKALNISWFLPADDQYGSCYDINVKWQTVSGAKVGGDKERSREESTNSCQRWVDKLNTKVSSWRGMNQLLTEVWCQLSGKSITSEERQRRPFLSIEMSTMSTPLGADPKSQGKNKNLYVISQTDVNWVDTIREAEVLNVNQLTAILC